MTERYDEKKETQCTSEGITKVEGVINMDEVLKNKIVEAIENVKRDMNALVELVKAIPTTNIATGIGLDEDGLVKSVAKELWETHKDEIIESIDYTDMVDKVSESVMDSIDMNDIAQNIDANDIAQYIDHNDLAREMDYGEVADCIDIDNLAEKIDVESIAEKIDVDEIASSMFVKMLNKLVEHEIEVRAAAALKAQGEKHE